MTDKPVFPDHMHAHGARGLQLQRVAWTPAQIALITKGAAEGLSSGEMAKMIGPHCSRCAVIGKLRRLGIQLATGTGPRPVKPAPVPDPDPPPAPVAAAEPAQAESQEAPPVVALLANPCLWPLGDPLKPGFRSCGEPRKAGKPYCEDHCAVAYTAARPYDPDATRKARGPFRASQVGQWS